MSGTKKRVNALVAMVQYIQIFKVDDPMFLQDEKWNNIEKKVNETKMKVMSPQENTKSTKSGETTKTLLQMRVCLEAL